MVRCTKCRFLFEAETPGLLPQCRQCGGETVGVIEIAPSDVPAAQPTMKLAIVKSAGAA
jgi:predicted  nucleic acid-binding Zn-ribbon protein